ncbi:MAG: toll/interleukin-1 receptor domain-containing protein [Verrucomicrobiales bacterium]|nr:toll/interleukin-1 receptor domain-containing protein [Verrucomicrobiales bacterium]
MIFLSYRRSDTSGHAGRLFDRLVDRFGREHVFMDVDTIRPGEDFARTIAERIGSCEVLIALIGDQWLAAAHADGRRRVDDTGDYVRAEITAALERGIPVIPVLVEGARMPAATDLPEPMRGLVRLQALEISDTRFDSEAQDLMAAVDQYRPHRQARRRRPPDFRRHALALGSVVVLAVAWALWRGFPFKTAPALSGRWVAEVTDPGRAPFQVVLDLQSAGERILGAVTYPTGSAGIQNGHREGRSLIFATEHVPQFGDRPVTMRFVAEIAGDELRGNLITDDQSRLFVARRAPP